MTLVMLAEVYYSIQIQSFTSADWARSLNTRCNVEILDCLLRLCIAYDESAVFLKVTPIVLVEILCIHDDNYQIMYDFS